MKTYTVKISSKYSVSWLDEVREIKACNKADARKQVMKSLDGCDNGNGNPFVLTITENLLPVA